MALQIWMPLNGDINNQGVASCTIANGGATSNASGKIGSCYYFDGSDDYISLTSSALYSTFIGGNQAFTIAFWFYNQDSGSRSIFFGDYGLSGAIGFNIEKSASETIRFYWNGSPDYYFSSGTTPANVWTHLTITYGNSALKLYINGVCTSTYSVTLSSKSKTSGAYYIGRDTRTGATAMCGKMNDFRIYDGCLSAREVKEISRGLVLHYPLNQPGRMPNLLTDTTNFGLTGSDYSSASTRTIGKTIISSDSNFNSYGWVTSYLGPGSSTIVNNTKTYTLSVDVKTTGLPNDTCARLIIDFRRNDHSYLVYGQTYLKTEYNGEWHRYSVSLTGSAQSQTVSLICFTGSGANGTTIEYKNFKLEEGYNPNGIWTPYYDGGAINDNTEYDTSGYKANGTVTGTISLVSSTPRNIIGLKFTSSNIGTSTSSGAAYLKGTLISQIVNPTALTISWWANMENWSYQNSGVLSLSNSSDSPSDYLDSTLNQYDSVFRFNNSSGTGGTLSATSIISNNAWHHYVLIFNGSACLGYRDGTLITSTSLAGPLASFRYVYLGLSVAGGAWRQTTGNWSDFRIYSTALSASDIQELYNSPISIANNNTLMVQGEFVEE